MSYTLLSLVFLVISAVVLVSAVARQRSPRALLRHWWLPVTIAGVMVIALTAVFDNIMIGVGLIAYDPHSISGLSIGLAPVEDFAYPLASLMLLPSLWVLLRKRGTDARR